MNSLRVRLLIVFYRLSQNERQQNFQADRWVSWNIRQLPHLGHLSRKDVLNLATRRYLTEFPSIEQRGLKEKFKYTTVFVILTTLVSYLTGVVIAKVQKDPSDKVPLKEKTLLGALFFTTVFATSTSLLYVSYPLHLLTRNLRLLSIFVVGVFFSRLKAVGKGHLGKQKLLIGLVITAGVLIFNSSQVRHRLM